jgi:4-amino-4-deoxy-L-arabinose transferase-like glycosyltransferase
MLSEIKKRWILFIGLLLFIIAKIPHLSCGFYWDESQVYGPAVKLMYAHGPSLLPNAIPVEYSRGHPLLFPAVCALWMDIFGQSNFVMHTFALFVSVILAITIFEILLRLFNQRTASISIILLLLNIYFFAESTFVLNDIMLGLLALLTLYFFVTKKYYLAALFLSMLLYTKESGLVACVPMGGSILMGMINKREPLRHTFLKIISLAIPLVLIALFFVLQKKMNGWYLTPGHVGLINFDIGNTLHNFKSTLNSLFYNEQNYYPFVVLLILSVFAAIKQRSWKYLAVPLMAVNIYLSLFVFSDNATGFYITTFFFLLLFLFFFFRRFRYYNDTQEQFIKIIAAFCVFYIYFCCVNFYETRYLMPALIFITVILMAIGIDFFLKDLATRTFMVVAGTLVVLGSSSFFIGANEYELRIYDRLKVQGDIIDFLEQNNYYDTNIYNNQEHELLHLINANSGFLHSSRTFINASNNIHKYNKLFIFDNMDSPDSRYEGIKNDSGFILLSRFQKGQEWVEVYERP